MGSDFLAHDGIIIVDNVLFKGMVSIYMDVWYIGGGLKYCNDHTRTTYTSIAVITLYHNRNSI